MAEHRKWHELVESIKQDRDEIQLKMHLASMELKDHWHELEHKWENTRVKLDKAEDEAEDAAEEIGEALHLALDELRQGYQKVRKALSQ